MLSGVPESVPESAILPRPPARSLLATLSLTALLLISGAIGLRFRTLQVPTPSQIGSLTDLMPQDTVVGIRLMPTDSSRQPYLDTLLSRLDWLQDLPAPLRRQLQHLGETESAFGDSLPGRGSANRQLLLLWLDTTTSRLPGIPRPSEPALVLPLTSAQPVEATLNDLRQQGQLTERQRAGRSWIGQLKPGYSVALLDQRYLAIAPADRPLAAILRAYRGQGRLISDPLYQRHCSDLSSDRRAEVYLDWPRAQAAAIAQGQALPLPPLSQRLCAGLTPAPTGLQLTGNAWPAQPPSTSTPNRGDLLRYAPANSLLWFSSQNLASSWQHFSQNNDQMIWPQLVSLPRDFQVLTGTDLQKEWLNWLTGDYAIALTPQTGDPRFRASLLFLAQTSNRRQIDTSRQRLEKRLTSSGRLRLQGDRDSVRWLSSQGQLLASYGWLDPRTLYVSIGAPTPRLPAQSLNFRQFDPQVTPQTDTLFYLDLDQLRRLGLLPAVGPLSPWLRPFQQALLSVGSPQSQAIPFRLSLNTSSLP
jgi:hypothetical protein